MVIKALSNEDLARIVEVDRSEHVTTHYTHESSALLTHEVDWRVPDWALQEWEPHMVRWARALEDDGVLLGALDGDVLAGFAILWPKLTESMAQLMALYVSRSYRRRGVAHELTREVERRAQGLGATCLYVSSTPSGSAVGFYRSQGFEPADEVNEELFTLEPEDIHLIKELTPKPPV